MEPVTHVLTGACLARTGFHGRIRYATAAMAIAAEFPDVDTCWGLVGPVTGFRHHRGITHTFIGVPFEAALLLLAFFLFHSWLVQRRVPRAASRVGAPVRWASLYGCLVLGLLSHLLLDYTNNYGLRPFFPFSSHWYAASIVFIFDPFIFALLVAGLVVPGLLALVEGEIGGRRSSSHGSGWARFALLGVVALWGLRSYEHRRAIDLADAQTLRAPNEAAGGEDSTTLGGAESLLPIREEARPLLFARRSLASPDPFNPFRWDTATDFGPVYLLGIADTRLESLDAASSLNKPVPTVAIAAAERTVLGRAYLDWSPMPWITQSAERGLTASGDGAGETTVSFEDVRFMGSSPLLHRRSLPPLTGFVVLGSRGEILQYGIDGRVQK